MGIETIIAMIPKGGKYAKSVVNFVHKVPQNWEKFKSAIQQIDDILKQGKLRLDGKQKTIFESNKNILKNYEKVNKDAYAQYDKAVKDKKNFIDKSAQITDDLFKGKVTKDTADLFKGWTPTLVERSNLRNVYKKLDPPERLYTKEMEAIDEELNELMLYREGKYAHLTAEAKAALHDKLQAAMKKLIDKAVKEDLSTLSLSQINKRSHAIQKRIREIADNPNIKGTVSEGPKRDMIKVIADSERKPLDKARDVIKRKNIELKYGTKFPRLDPENDAFIILGLDSSGSLIKVSRFSGRFSATKDWKTGDLTRKEGTSFWDTWDPKKNQMRKEGEEVFHETLNSEGKVIMTNPEYKLPKTQNMELQNEFYTDLSTSELSKKGYKLKEIDMIVKGRKVREYLDKTKSKDTYISMHEQTSSNEIGAVLEDLYNRGDDVYKMSMKEWITKIPEYFARGGHVPGFATGGVSNLFRQRQGYRDAGTVIKLAKGARWLIRMLKEMSDDMIFGRNQFAKMTEALKMKYFKETESAIKHLEAGGPIPEHLLKTMRADKRFQDLTVSKTGDKDFIEMQEVVLGDKFPKDMRKFMGRPLKTEDFVEIDLMTFKKELPADIIANLNKLPVEDQTVLLTRMKKAFDTAKKGGIESGAEVLQEQLLTDFIPKGKPHATGGLIDGYATGGVSNLFRSR